MQNNRGTLFENEDECLRLAEQILKQYEGVLGRGCRLRLMQFSENRTYLVRNAAGDDLAVLRLCRPGYHTADELRSEIEWLRALDRDMALQGTEHAVSQRADAGHAVLSHIRFSIPVAGDSGTYIHSAADRDGIVYNGIVFEYMEGVLLEELTPDQQIPWFDAVGMAAATLHRQVRRWADAGDMKRFHWNYETTLGIHAIWDDWRKNPSLDPQMFDVLEAADRMIRGNLAKYGIREDNYGLIHGDLRAANLLTDGDTLGVIDFDDCGYGWYMQDIAASLSFIEAQDNVRQLIDRWLGGYDRIGKLCKEDTRMIPTFVMMRRLQLLAWVTSRRDSDAVTAQIAEKDFAADTAELAERYLNGWLSDI